MNWWHHHTKLVSFFRWCPKLHSDQDFTVKLMAAHLVINTTLYVAAEVTPLCFYRAKVHCPYSTPLVLILEILIKYLMTFILWIIACSFGLKSLIIQASVT